MAIPLGPGDPALTYALGGLMRGGIGRAGAVDGRVYIAIDGVQVGWARDEDYGTLIGSLSISDILDETPNRCTFRLNGIVPPQGAEIVLTLGSKNRLERLFAGSALTVQQLYAGIPANVQADCSAIDYTWILGFTKVTAAYSNQTAGAIIRDLVERFAGVNGFTATAVAADLPVLEEITFTNEDLPTAISRTCRRAGAYWYCDYHKVVHAFVEEVRNGAPRPLVPAHRSMTRLAKTGETTQVLGRVYVEGRGSRLLASVNPGDDRIPLDSVDMFAPAADVFLKASFQGAEGGATHLAFSGVVAGGAGSLVGPGSAPGAAPGPLTLQTGGAVELGAHGYAYSWQTAAGETKPSAIGAITVATIATPTSAPGIRIDAYQTPVDPNQSGAWRPGDLVEFAYAYGAVYQNSLTQYQTPLSPLAGIVAVLSPYYVAGSAPGTNASAIEIQYPYSPDPNVTQIHIYHRVNGGGWRLWLNPANANVPEWTVSSWQSYTKPAAFSQPFAPAVASPNFRTVKVEGIAIGPAGTIARKLYRTKANAAQLQLATTLADNATTIYTDAAADGTLTTNAPAGDTSGLKQPEGQIQPGAAEIIVASTAPFEAAGGWAILGNGDQVVRYTALGAGKLTGLPASGRGSLRATVVYNTTITSAPMLTGIPASGARAIWRPLTDGDEIYLVVQVDNAALQATLAALLHVPNGAREDWIQDRRLSITEARARGQASLALRPLEEISVEYLCRDLLTASGKTIHVELPAPTNILGDFKIQQVTITNFRPVVGRALPNVGQYPTYRVQASSAWFSFEDLLNRFRVKE